MHVVLAPWGRLPRTIDNGTSALWAQNPEVRILWTVVHQFHTMVRHRYGGALEPWLAHLTASGIPALHPFAESLRTDYAAVRAGLTERWNQGPVEGHNPRLTRLNRLGSGRAGFALLRQRVLYQR